MWPTRTPSRKRRPKLRPGTCFKATRLECEREQGKAVRVKAEEIHTVVDHDDPYLVPCINPDVRCFPRDPSSYEMRKIYTSSSFKVKPLPQHLKIEETENGTPIVDVEDGPLETAFFPPMRMVSGVGYRETNVANVLLGVDPSHWHLWVTPVAFQLIKLARTKGTDICFGKVYKEAAVHERCGEAHFTTKTARTFGEMVAGRPHPDNSEGTLGRLNYLSAWDFVSKQVRDQVIEAGGVFISDFDTSASGWAVFHTMYICPAPSKSLYVQACRVESPLIECCGPGSGRVFAPLRCCGGRVFKEGFAPGSSDIFDPVVFKSIDRILDDSPSPGAIVAESDYT